MHYNEVVLENNIQNSTKKPVVVLKECSPLQAFATLCETYDMTGTLSATEGSEELQTFGAMARIVPGKYVTMTVRKKGNEWEYTFTNTLGYLPVGTSFDLTERSEEEEEEEELEEMRTVKDKKSGDQCCHDCGTALGRGGDRYFDPKPNVKVTNIYAGVSYDQEERENVFEFRVWVVCPTCEKDNVHETNYILE